MVLLNYAKHLFQSKKLVLTILLLIPLIAFGGEFFDNLRLDGNTVSSTSTNGDIILDPNGTGGVKLNDLTATTVPYLDANKALTSSAVTPTELGYVGSVTSAIQTQLDAKLDDFTSSTDNVLMRSNGTGGAAVQESGIIVDDSDNVSAIGTLSATGVIHGAVGLEFDQISTPASPASADNKLYFKSDDKLYTLDSGGAEVEVGSGGGGGSKNWIDNNDIESNTTGWSTYDDTGAFIDGSGGSPATVTISRNTTTPLDGNGDLKISKAATDGSGEGVCVTTDTIGQVYRGGQFNLDFWWDGDDSNNTDTDWAVKIYDIGGTAIVTNLFCVAGCNADGTLPKQKTKVYYNGIAGSSMSSARICFHLASDSQTGSAVSLYVDEIRAGPDGLVPGSIQDDIGTVAMVDSWTNSTTSCDFKRKGSDLFADCRATVTGVGATAFNLTMPTGYIIDTAGFMTNRVVGQARLTDSGSGTNLGSVLFTDSTTLQITANQSSSTYALPAQLTSSVPFTWASGDFIDFNFKVPIVGWKTGAMLSSNEVSLQVVKTKAVKQTPTGSLGAAFNTMIFGTIAIDEHSAYNTTTGVYTAPYAGEYQVSAFTNYTYTSGTTKTGYVRIVNTTTSEAIDGIDFSIGASTQLFPKIAGVISASKGDSIEVQSWINGVSPTYTVTASAFSIVAIPNFRVFSNYVNGRVEDDIFRVLDDNDNTKQFALQLSGITTGTTRTVTVPDASGTMCLIDATQTLTAKTLTSPVLNTGVSGTAVLDEDNMATDSPTQLATQQSIKAYVDAVTIDTETPTTTKGDILVEDGSNVIRLAVGSNDQVLTADSTQASGIKWAAAGGGGGTSIVDADADTQIQVEESADEDKIRFDTLGSERMIIDNAGLVGIGQTTPTAALHIEAPTTTTPSLYIKERSSQTSDLLTIDDSAGTLHWFTVQDDGKVGLGTNGTSPITQLAQFEIVKDGTTSGDMSFLVQILDISPFSTRVGGGLYLGGRYNSSTSTGWAGVWSEKENTTSGQYGGRLLFGTRPHGGVVTAAIMIDADQTVGIGTESPATRLEVSEASGTFGGAISMGVTTSIVGFYYATSTSSQSCTTTCEAEDANAGYNSSSGVCQAAWTSGAAISACATAAADQKCLCMGAN